MDASNSTDEARAERKRKRKSRWAGTESEKTFIPGMPTVLPAGMTPDQQQAYLGMFFTYIFLNFHQNKLKNFHHSSITNRGDKSKTQDR